MVAIYIDIGWNNWATSFSAALLLRMPAIVNSTLFRASSRLFFILSFWLLSSVARRHPYSQRAHAEADREAEGHRA
jgi:hypothetical protein